MSLLSNDYYKNLINNSQAPDPAPAIPAPASAPQIDPAPQTPTIPVASPFANAPANPADPTVPIQAPEPKAPVEDTGAAVHLAGDASPELQADRAQFAKDHPTISSFLSKDLAQGFGLRLPADEEWNKMGYIDQTLTLLKAGVLAGGRMLEAAPREIVRAPLRIAATTLAPFESMARGEKGDFDALKNAPRINLPWVGEIPTYYQSFDDARKAGLGPLAATLQTTGNAAGDVAMTGSLVESMTKAFQPRRLELKPGEQVVNTAPVQKAIDKETGVFRQKAQSDSEYYPLPKTLAKAKYGGTTADTFFKITPAGEGQMEVSVVKLRGGKIPKAVDYVKEKMGMPVKISQGDFGPEVKLESQTVPVGKPSATLPEAAPGAEIKPVISEPLKGFEDKPVTEAQISNLSKIGQVNGIEPGISDSVIRTITGKDTVGELTQAEYSKVAQTLASFNEISKYSPEAPAANIFARYGSPQRHWMRNLEEKSGVPLYSQAYVPMEEATRLRNVFRNSYRNQAREIFGDYAKPGQGEARRAVKYYMEGDKSAIMDNPAFDDKTKADLVKISDQMRPLYDKLGNIFGIPTDVFLKDYQPHIQNIGGVHQLYKEGQNVPKEMSFFADFKRHGSLGVQVDDALGLFDIYTNAGSNKTFMNPALERIAALGEKLPSSLQGSLKSYVQEKMGYAGPLEEWLNKVGGQVGQKLGINVPPDIARQLTQVAMDTTYSGAMGLNPGTVFRNSLQYDLMAYPRLGPKFYVDALRKALTKEGVQELRDRGFLVDQGTPYGEDLTEGSGATADGVIGANVNRYRKITQGSLAPFSAAENLNRTRTYFQTKMQFEDALSRYNSGKLNWPQLEKELDFTALSPIDRNIIRQRIVAGDTQGAFENLVRDVLDETQFPYRKGASSRITYGLTGKLGTQFMQYSIEFAHTMKRWIQTGQYDKLIRFFGASSAINRTMRDSFGFDFSNSVGLGPVSPSLSPLVKSASDIQGMFANFKTQNDQEFEKNKDDLVRTLKSLGIPAGVEQQKVGDFFKSYNHGPDATGKYSVFDQQGRLKYKTDFKDLWWTLFGFPSAQNADSTNLNREMRNAQFNRGLIKQQALQLMQQGKNDEANKLISENAIQISPSDFDQYFIPQDQRTFQSLPPVLKGQFAPRVFSQ